MANQGIIQVTPEQLRSEAKKIRKIRDNHDTEMNNLTRLMGNLETTWKGNSQNAYYSKFNEAQKTFQAFSTMLKEFAELMEYSANEMEAKDAELASKVSKATVGFN